MGDEYRNNGLGIDDLNIDALEAMSSSGAVTAPVGAYAVGGAPIPVVPENDELVFASAAVPAPAPVEPVARQAIPVQETAEEEYDGYEDEPEEDAGEYDDGYDDGEDDEYDEYDDDEEDEDYEDEDDEEDDEEADAFYRRRRKDDSDSDKRELHPMKIRKTQFLILAGRVAAALVLLVLSLTMSKNQITSLLLLLGGFLVIGADLFYKAVIEALEGNVFNNNLLIAVASVASFLIGKNSEGVVLLIIYQVGTMLINIAVSNSHKIITQLLDMRPTVAHMVKDGEEIDCSVSDLIPGDVFVVHPGERLPVDGLVIGGEGNIDASQISGASRILSASAGDALYSGSINMDNDLTLRAVTSYSDSTVAKILNVIDNAAEKKGDSERFISKFSKIYTPCAFAAALIIGLVVPLISGLELAVWVARGINILVIACPGALMVSVPLSYFAAIGRAAVKGVLFKGANVVDDLSKASTVVFDKQSAMSSGKLDISSINPISGVSQAEVLTLAAFAHISSTTAVSRCIVEAAGPMINRNHVKRFHEEPGKGIVCQVGEKVLVISGTREFLSLLKINCPYEYKGQEVLYVCRNKDYIGSICLDYTSNAAVAGAIRDIRRNDVDRIIMLTDETPERAREHAASVGISEFFAEVGPEAREERMRHLLEMSLDGDKLVYVGDSDEDAALLRVADVGVTVSGIGTEDAVNAADVIMLSDDPGCIPQALNISKGVQKVITMNMIVALGVKTAIMLLALPGAMLAWMAELIDIAVALFTVVNAMRAFDPDRFGLHNLPEILNPMSSGALPAVRVKPVRQRDPNSPRARAQQQDEE